MSTHHSFSRREFLNTAIAAGLFSTLSPSQTAPVSRDFPYVDGLCVYIFEKPEEIRASGLSALVYDVSSGETIPDCDGAPKWRRTFEATLQSISNARTELQKVTDVFLTTDGKQIGDAFRNNKTAVFFQVQGGGEVVGEDLSRLEQLKKQGLRILQLTHHHNNPLGGGGIVKNPTGLTKIGFEAIHRMNALDIIPDLSHASDQTGFDTLKASKKPVIVSHGASRAIVNNARCTPDSVIRGVADSGGVMGVFMMSFWLTTDAVPTIDSYIRQLRHVINIGGIDAVGIANDFALSGDPSLNTAKGDNAEAVKNYLQWWNSIASLGGVLGFDKKPVHVAIPELNNIARIHTIRAALEKEKFKASEIEKIMGGNWIRLLSS